MRIACQWLKSLLDLPTPELEALTPAAIASMLTSLGLEVEAREEFGAGVEGVIVGEVRSRRPHPQADRLTMVEIFDGAKIVPVVCGAPNVPEPGGKVAFAPVGATLPGGMAIAAREVRGARSEGMICSETELEIGADGAGILVLPQEMSAGTRLSEAVPGIVDTVLEVSVTPNRPDALGHLGVARDLAARLGCGLRTPAVAGLAGIPTIEGLVRSAAPARCGRYRCFVIEGVRVGPSPLWLRVRLHRLGLRAINNCVDITNLVLFEMGQPLHAFDRAALAEERVIVRLAGEGEEFAALDGSQRTLRASDLVIADAAAPQALAGVMGGARSMVRAQTRSILLEVAYFAPPGIRATARRVGLASDSSYRFERGTDYGIGLDRAAARALALFQEITGGICVGQGEALGELPTRPEIELRPGRVNHVLGLTVSAEEALRALRGLEVAVEVAAAGAPWRCTPPTHRPDLTREVDLIEEIMRMHGLEGLPAVATVPSSPVVERQDPLADRREALIDALCAAGLHQHVAYAFTSPEKLRPFLREGEEQTIVALQNPLRGPISVMRTSLLPGLLDALEGNAARHPHAVRLFEVGKVYAWGALREPVNDGVGAGRAPAIATIDRELPVEPEMAALALYSPRGAASEGASAAVGVMLFALRRLGYQARVVPMASASRVAYLHPGVQAAIEVWSEGAWLRVGAVGELHPDARAGRELPPQAKIVVGEIAALRLPTAGTSRARELPRFPSTSRDLSLEIPQTLAAFAVVEALVAAEQGIAAEGEDPARLRGDGVIDAVEVVEDYRGHGVPAGQRALLLRLHYRASGRSVTDDEVQRLHAAVIEAASSRLRPLAPELRVR
ncbi:MAG: phenylalanine--tRNA ligase subunit beta [Nannocystis sp.]|nr:phenylalanine--tRNA ligase subunit beta [Nannocystis sp.]